MRTTPILMSPLVTSSARRLKPLHTSMARAALRCFMGAACLSAAWLLGGEPFSPPSNHAALRQAAPMKQRRAARAIEVWSGFRRLALDVTNGLIRIGVVLIAASAAFQIGTCPG